MEETTPDRQQISEGQYCFINDDERLAFVSSRIREKLVDYEEYDFSSRQVRALNIFFDLTQEFRGRELFYHTALNILRLMFKLESSLYVMEDEETFVLAGESPGFGPTLGTTRTWDHEFGTSMQETDEHVFVPVRCNPYYSDMLPFDPPDDIIGCFVLRKSRDLFPEMRLFLRKYVNRIGYQLHNRIMRDRSREHLKFIRNLVEDIGHNVIVPNMYFKLYFNSLSRIIRRLDNLGQEMRDQGKQCLECSERIHSIHADLKDQFDEIYRHYVQTSMFLETLLRRKHFEEGRYVLEKKPCNLRTQIIDPQLERYRHRLDERGIEIDMTLGGAPPDQIIRLMVDIGLISQVFANLFSNAVKYTRKSELPDGRKGLFVSYGWKVIRNHFAPGIDGIRLYVFSSGKPLELVEPMEVFEPGFRAANRTEEAGTGHGLYFVRQVVELHRGEVGYLPRAYGNEFYFILPFEVEGAPLPDFLPRSQA